MSSKKSSETAADSGKASKNKKNRRQQGDGTRETVESIAIAFVLAFLFKTFQAEAYVIPTGSMAPTLYGRHKDVTCSECGFNFALGASSELNQETGYLETRITEAVCSNCGSKEAVKEAAVFNGDRILVNKQVSNFRRFDVVVFKNPEQGHVNYIKRLVGLPNETLRIRKGDLWVRKQDEDHYAVQRKPYSVQKDIQLTVYDDNHPALTLIEAGWPERWEPSVQAANSDSIAGWVPGADSWSADREARSYSCKTSATDEQWLRYRHFMPETYVWEFLRESGANGLPRAQPSLIADFCSFNSSNVSQDAYWVGDLTINANVSITEANDSAKMLLELVEGPRTFQCRVDLTTGQAELTEIATANPTALTTIAKAATPLKGTGEWDVTFANVDDRLALWVDGTLMKFDGSTEYDGSEMPQPTQKDLSPVGIAVQNASATVSNLLLERDIYYRNDIVAFDHKDGLSDSNPYHGHQDEVGRVGDLRSQLHNPEAWAATYEEASTTQLESYGEYGEYQLDSDEYLMFGDNSSMSKDSRLFDYQARPMNGIFSHRYAVRERDLIGKALFIFWPHGIPFLNGGEGIPVRYHKAPPNTPADIRNELDAGDYPSVRVPFYPNVGRMKKIR